MITGVSRDRMEALAGQYGLTITAISGTPRVSTVALRKPRIAVYQPWGSNMDEGWTRWLLDRYGFEYTTLHPQDLRAASGADGDFDIPEEERSNWPTFVAHHWPIGSM